MNKILSAAAALVAAIAIFFALPHTTYSDAAAAIPHPYAQNIVAHEGYHRDQLDEAQQQLYDVVKEGLLNTETEILVQRLGYTDEDLWHVMWAVIYDTPEMFWVDWLSWNIRDTAEGFVIIPAYGATGDDLAAQVAAFEEATAAFMEDAAKETFATDYDKALFVHDWLCDTVNYDEGVDDLPVHTAYGALVDKKAVCDGYANAYVYLLGKLDITECYLIGGDTVGNDTPYGHAWNLVELDGAAYYVDVTWDDLDNELDPTTPNEYIVSHSYFLLGEDTMARTHIPDGEFEYPAAIDYNYFSKLGLAGMKYEDVADAAAQALCDNVLEGRYHVEVCIADEKEFDLVQDSYEYAAEDLIESANALLKKAGSSRRISDESVWFSGDDEAMTVVFIFDEA